MNWWVDQGEMTRVLAPTVRHYSSLGQRPRRTGTRPGGRPHYLSTNGYRPIDRAFSAKILCNALPGAMPQAGIMPRRWRWIQTRLSPRNVMRCPRRHKGANSKIAVQLRGFLRSASIIDHRKESGYGDKREREIR